MRKYLIAGAAIAVFFGGGYVALFHSVPLFPHAPIHNAQTAKLDKDISEAQTALKKYEADFAPLDTAQQQRLAREKKINQDIQANSGGFFSEPSPALKRLWGERDALRREFETSRYKYTMAKFKVAAARKNIAELQIQLLAAQQGERDLSISELKETLAVREAALKTYEEYAEVLGNLQSQITLKYYALQQTVSIGPGVAGRARYEQAKHGLTVIEGPRKKFDAASEQASRTLQTKRQEIAALKEALMSPEERRNRDAMRAMVMRSIAEGMANLPDPDYEHIIGRNFAVCRSGNLTAPAPAPATIGAPCQISDGVNTVQGTVSAN